MMSVKFAAFYRLRGGTLLDPTTGHLLLHMASHYYICCFH